MDAEYDVPDKIVRVYESPYGKPKKADLREIECVVHDRTADWKYRQDMLLSVVKTKEGKWTVNPEEIILLGMEEVE